MRAREAAARLLATLDHNEMVPRFLDMYAAENRRPGRADQPAYYREQLETIRREALLAMVLRAEAALPTRLKVRVTVRETKRRQKQKKGKKSAKARRQKKKPARKPGMDLAIPLLDLFREEFFVALGQALRWTDEDAQAFWHDLELYESLAAQRAAARLTAGHRLRTFCGPHRAAAGSVADGTGSPRRRKVSAGAERFRRPRPPRRILAPSRQLIRRAREILRPSLQHDVERRFRRSPHALESR